MAPVWSLIGVAAALAWVAILRWSDRHPRRRMWPPHRASLRTASWAWGLTVAIYLGVLQAGFAAPNALGLPGWLRWGAGLTLSLAGSVPHTLGTLALGLKATSGWPGPLATSGIYRWRRHPQYIGQGAMLLGMAVVGGTFWALWPALAGCAALVWAARVEDRHLAATHPGHAAYRRATRAI